LPVGDLIVTQDVHAVSIHPPEQRICHFAQPSSISALFCTPMRVMWNCDLNTLSPFPAFARQQSSSATAETGATAEAAHENAQHRQLS
jgi:hypothetical protein